MQMTSVQKMIQVSFAGRNLLAIATYVAMYIKPSVTSQVLILSIYVRANIAIFSSKVHNDRRERECLTLTMPCTA